MNFYYAVDKEVGLKVEEQTAYVKVALQDVRSAEPGRPIDKQALSAYLQEQLMQDFNIPEGQIEEISEDDYLEYSQDEVTLTE